MKRALLAAALALPACFSAAQNRQDALTREARTFNDDLHWARWQPVSAAMAPAEGQAFLGRVAELEDELVLGDQEVTAINFGPDAKVATVTTRLEWYLRRDLRVRTTVIDETWEYQGGHWVVTKLRRSRGDRLGLITEPIGSGDPGPAPR